MTIKQAFFVPAKSDAPKAAAAKAPAAAPAKPKVPKAKKPVPKKTDDKKVEGAGGDVKSKKVAPRRKVVKAEKIAKKIVKGTHGTRIKKVRTTVHFKRPRTFRPPRNPKYPRKSVPRRSR